MVSISRNYLLCYCLLLAQVHLFAQENISGKVIDGSSGEGLAYVNIHVVNSTTGTTSDQKGNFQLDGVQKTDGIIFSMIGFKTFVLENVSRESDPILIELHPEVYLAEEVVISASRKTQSLSLAPASVGIVAQVDLVTAGVKSFDDAFHQISGVQVTRSSGSNVQALSIRGASEVAGGGIGNRVLLLLDGRPAITPESGGALWNLVPLGAVERIEVIKGAYSSLFGSSAMGGIINVITRSPDTIARTDINLQYGFYSKAPDFADYDQYNDFFGADLTHSGRNGHWSYIFNGAAKTNEGHREKTSFMQYNAYGKLGYHFSPNRSIQFSAMYNDLLNDTPATWLSTLQPYHVAAHRKDDKQHRRELNADIHYVAYAHADVKYSARFYYYGTNSDYIFNGDPDNDSTNVNQGKQFIDEEKVYVHRLGQSTQVDVKVGSNHYLISGLEMQSDDIDGRPDTVLYGKHKAWNIGAYVQDQWIVGDRLIITGGLRFDQYKIIHTFSEGNFSPKIAAVYQLSPDISIRGLIAQAFRNPSISERFTKFEQGAGLSFRPNPSLRSERLTLSAEAGSKISLAQNLKVDVAVYYNHYRDLISYRQRFIPGEPFLFEVINLNKAIMQGFEISSDYMPWNWLHIQAGYSFLDARDQSDQRFNDVLPYKSKHTGYVSATVIYEKLNLFLQARGRSDIHEVFIYPGSEPEGYVIFNSRISYALNKNFSASIAVSNMTNELYEEIERYRMESRNFTLGIRYSL